MSTCRIISYSKISWKVQWIRGRVLASNKSFHNWWMHNQWGLWVASPKVQLDITKFCLRQNSTKHILHNTWMLFVLNLIRLRCNPWIPTIFFHWCFSLSLSFPPFTIAYKLILVVFNLIYLHFNNLPFYLVKSKSSTLEIEYFQRNLFFFNCDII